MLADTLHGLKQVRGFTFTDVEGHGAKDGGDATLSARDDVVGYVPHVRVDILLEDEDVADVLAMPCATADAAWPGGAATGLPKWKARGSYEWHSS